MGAELQLDSSVDDATFGADWDDEATSFVQVRKHQEIVDDAALRPRNRIISLLKANAADLHSPEISLLAMRIAEDPFAKVKVARGLLLKILLGKRKL